MSVGLVVVFNHAFEANLPRLDALYANRFSDVRYLMPFYQGTRTDVSSTSHSSYSFQGFFAEAYQAITNPRHNHYLFVGDDLLLRRDANERNVLEMLRADAHTGYIKELLSLGETKRDWTHALAAPRTLRKNRFVEFDRQLPERTAADSHLLRAGRTVRDLSRGEALRRLMDSWRHDRTSVFLDNLIYALHHQWRASPRLPLLAGYSDLVLVPSAAIQSFCFLCGVFAALGMFVEIAIPTALALSCSRVHTEKDISFKGREIWNAVEGDALLTAHDCRLQAILEAMPSELLYIHPVKLSRLRF